MALASLAVFGASVVLVPFNGGIMKREFTQMPDETPDIHPRAGLYRSECPTHGPLDTNMALPCCPQGRIVGRLDVDGEVQAAAEG